MLDLSLLRGLDMFQPGREFGIIIHSGPARYNKIGPICLDGVSAYQKKVNYPYI